MDFYYILKIICDYVFLLCIPGDVFGVCVTHFGKQMSTVTFVKNGTPVATRYD